LDKPLHVIYKASKLAYRILVILIANKRVKKKVNGGGKSVLYFNYAQFIKPASAIFNFFLKI
jgi:hypothetical protein